MAWLFLLHKCAIGPAKGNCQPELVRHEYVMSQTDRRDQFSHSLCEKLRIPSERGSAGQFLKRLFKNWMRCGWMTRCIGRSECWNSLFQNYGPAVFKFSHSR